MSECSGLMMGRDMTHGQRKVVKFDGRNRKAGLFKLQHEVRTEVLISCELKKTPVFSALQCMINFVDYFKKYALLFMLILYIQAAIFLLISVSFFIFEFTIIDSSQVSLSLNCRCSNLFMMPLCSF